jgi:hypothetical protein
VPRRKDPLRVAIGDYGYARKRKAPPEEIERLHAEMVTEQIRDYVAKLLVDAPPLSAEQRDRLAALFRSEGA